MSVADLQGWMTAIGVMGTAAVSLAGFIQSLRNGRAIVSTNTKVEEIHLATNGMKKELESKAYEAGARSTEDNVTAATRAADTAATAAKVVAEAAKTAADLVAATAAARKP